MRGKIAFQKNSWIERSMIILMSIALVFGMAPWLGIFTANADTGVSDVRGAFTVTADSQADLDAVTYDSNTLTFGADTAGKSFTVKQTSGVDTATSDRMVVKDIAADKPVTITLDGVNVESSAAAMQIEGSSAVNLVLKDKSKNTLRAGGACAGLYVQENASIIISGNTGSLTVAGSSDAAGIGSSGYDKTGTIDIRGGIITANGGSDGAGIGSGFYGKNGTINISGGTVTATGGEFAAGIGGRKDAGEINITGGTVTATGNYGAAGIGGCNWSPGGTVNISGGKVTAYGGDEAAGIGGGYGGNGGVINISEGTVTAIGGKSVYWDEDHYYSGGSGIGSGGTYQNQNTTTGATLKIGNKATVIAASTGERPAITTDGDITETEGGTVANIIQADFASVLPMDTTVEVKDILCESLGTKLAYNVTKDYLKTIAFTSPEIESATAYTLAATPKEGEVRNQQNGPDDNPQVAFTTLDGGIADFTNVKDTELWPLVVGDKVDGYKAGEEVSVTAEPDSEGREFAKWTVVSGNLTLTNPESETITFNMPACAVELKPIYKEKPAPEPAKPTKPTQVSNPKLTATANSATVTWAKIAGADGYYIYGAPCGKELKKLKTIKSANVTKWTQKNLKNGKNYKIVVKAYKKSGTKVKIINTSISVHVATPGSKSTNAKKVTANFSSATLKTGKAKQIKAKIVKQNSKKPLVNHVSKFRYKTNNKKVATVSKGGKIKAVGKGKCNIYVYANNGAYKKISVTVK